MEILLIYNYYLNSYITINKGDKLWSIKILKKQQ